jgi:AraC-like DNA-binding protein
MSQPTVNARLSRTLVTQLKRSRIYRDYERAFREATGLPIALRPIETFDLPHRGDPKENPLCALVAESNGSCAACLRHQRRVEEEAQVQPRTLACFAGLVDSSVPVRVGENLIAFLQTGQILLHEPGQAEFDQTARQLAEWGAEIDARRVKDAYFKTRVVTRKQYDSILRLLTIFAQHLAALSNQLLVASTSSGPPAMAKARELIAARYAEELTLGEMARAVSMSECYFCKSFRKAAGMTFTDYLARVRIEKVKGLLLQADKRISEAAYEVGFQSLSQFNRVFRRVAGESPTAFRGRLHGGEMG